MKEEMTSFLYEDAGNVLVTDAQGEFTEEGDCTFLSEKARKVWSSCAPEAHLKQRGEIWEFLDADKKKYYRVTTSSFVDGSQLCQMHHLVDITEYAAVFKNISDISTQWEEISRFQTAILRHLSDDITSILPDIASVFHSTEVLLHVRTEHDAHRYGYNRKTKCMERIRIRRDDAAFSLKPQIFLDGFVCFVQAEQYALLLKAGKRLDTEKLSDAMLLSAVHLFLTNCILKAQIIYDSEHDRLTGLYNKGKYMSMLGEQFGSPDQIAVFNMDVNNLKYMNDTFGHEMGDRLIVKAAQSLLAVTDDNVYGFRMGGDEFMMVAVGLSEQEAQALKIKWEQTVTALDQEDSSIPLVIACGMVCGERPYVLDDLLQRADQLMYEDKKQKKANSTIPSLR